MPANPNPRALVWPLLPMGEGERRKIKLICSPSLIPNPTEPRSELHPKIHRTIQKNFFAQQPFIALTASQGQIASATSQAHGSAQLRLSQIQLQIYQAD